MSLVTQFRVFVRQVIPEIHSYSASFNETNLSTHVIQAHVLQMLNVFIKMVLALVAVSKTILEIHTKDAVLSVYCHLIAHLIRLAFETNVKIHVRVYAV